MSFSLKLSHLRAGTTCGPTFQFPSTLVRGTGVPPTGRGAESKDEYHHKGELRHAKVDYARSLCVAEVAELANVLLQIQVGALLRNEGGGHLESTEGLPGRSSFLLRGFDGIGLVHRTFIDICDVNCEERTEWGKLRSRTLGFLELLSVLVGFLLFLVLGATTPASRFWCCASRDHALGHLLVGRKWV